MRTLRSYSLRLVCRWVRARVFGQHHLCIAGVVFGVCDIQQMLDRGRSVMKSLAAHTHTPMIGLRRNGVCGFDVIFRTGFKCSIYSG